MFSEFFRQLKNKNKKKVEIFQNRNNEELIQELRLDGISEKILSAIRMVPREYFTENIIEAYKNIALRTEKSQTLTQPICTAKMIGALNLSPSNIVAEIGTGVGWATAIISKLAKEVYTIEIFKSLLEKAKNNIAKLGITNVHFKHGNGYKGWGKNILFDSIIIGAATETVPPELFESLKPKGNLVYPKKYNSGNQKLLLIKKKDEYHFDQKELFDVKFVPLINKSSEK